MVFLIQNTQNRDAKAMHLKLDELIRAVKGARNQLSIWKTSLMTISRNWSSSFKDCENKRNIAEHVLITATREIALKSNRHYSGWFIAADCKVSRTRI
jgi:Predicted small integral membrane protein